MNSPIHVLLKAACCTLALLTVATAWAEPPRWVVRDADSELVLFGTIHFLPNDLDWHSPGLVEQLSQADEVWFEADPATLQSPELQQLVMQRGIDASTSLSEKLGDDLYQKLIDTAGNYGLPEQQLAMMQPWLASITLTSVAIMRAGFNPSAGVDMQLHAMLGDQAIRSLESAEIQIRMLADLPVEQQVDMLASTLDQIDDGTERFRELTHEWAAGETAGLEAMMVDSLQDDYPEVFDALFTRRNAEWVEQLEAELVGSGTDFVAVGVGHLVGEGSVVDLLRERGWTVERVDASAD